MRPAPTASTLAPLKALQSKVFGTIHNPDQLRIGSKVLKQRLVGPSMLTYYPPTIDLASLTKTVPAVGKLVHFREVQRLKDVERKKMLGKGPPKKGEGRRAAMKSKKK
ncbi:hypothetical protein IE53DRAFT_372677 [Violaceomyces palustris]|uniref:Uncharacterized protein n=1 Tax=Violaceomyces palustris TaxID=1673888 RepID=A0ACD0P801_9BASI|nr:hypothetical protein IE53DRAFT_372677 [Violaceomyces palustris]